MTPSWNHEDNDMPLDVTTPYSPDLKVLTKLIGGVNSDSIGAL